MSRAPAIFLFALFPLLAWAQPPLSAADARAVRQVIEAQLDAFRHDDAPRAFSYAAEGIRRTFGTPESFMEMVRSGYAAVYRPRSVAFDVPVVENGEVFELVRLTDVDGRAWFALY
ncbi:MAG TPA: DUF4864 domain-containing protein, partial [Burkholderiales bacterium]|nr:DUF4864 domain-containing protein [Burkholderiales bacterium]